MQLEIAHSRPWRTTLGFTPATWHDCSWATVVLFAQSAEGSARTPVDVYGSNINDVNLVITPNLEVRGRLLSPDGGTVRLSDRRVFVILQPRDTPLNVLANSVKSDGTFSIPNAPPDTYAVNFRNLPEGYFVKEIRIGANKLTDGTLNLAGGPTAGYLDVLLSKSGGELGGTLHNSRQISGNLRCGQCVVSSCQDTRLVTRSDSWPVGAF